MPLSTHNQPFAAPNLLKNGGFRDGLAYWNFLTDGVATAAATVTYSDATWCLRDGDVPSWARGVTTTRGSVAHISVGNETGANKNPRLTQEVPVTAGQYYSCTALFGVHRLNTGTRILLQWVDESGAQIGTSNTILVPATLKTGGPAYDDWLFMSVGPVQAPAGAQSCIVHLWANVPITSGTDGHLFMDQVWFGIGPPQKYATVPPVIPAIADLGLSNEVTVITPYTPSWLGGPPSVGTGGSILGNYIMIGPKLCYFEIAITLGGSANVGLGTYSVTLPFISSGLASRTIIDGVMRIAVGDEYPMMLDFSNSTNSATMRTDPVTAGQRFRSANSTNPATSFGASGDLIAFSGIYRIA